MRSFFTAIPPPPQRMKVIVARCRENNNTHSRAFVFLYLHTRFQPPLVEYYSNNDKLPLEHILISLYSSKSHLGLVLLFAIFEQSFMTVSKKKKE